jgi:hypothetical protein
MGLEKKTRDIPKALHETSTLRKANKSNLAETNEAKERDT